MKENKASITIQAPPREVWKILTDLTHYHEWNPLFVKAKGTIDDGELLTVKMRLPLTLLCGAPMSYSLSPKITKVEHESCLEWFGPAGMMGFVNATHYFQLASSHGGNVTEFTQGERYQGWGLGLYAGFGSVEDARRGFVAMNNALRMETLRRREAAGEKSVPRDPKDEDEEIVQLDISDRAAVTAATTTASAALVVAGTTGSEQDAALKTDEDVREGLNSSPGTDLSAVALATTPVHELASSSSSPDTGAIDTAASAPVQAPVEKPVEKRTSIIGAVTSMFSCAKPSTSERFPVSASKDDLISKAVPEEEGEDSDERKHPETGGHPDEDEDEDEEEMEDSVSKQEREAKNSERIELDLGSSDMSLGDFGL